MTRWRRWILAVAAAALLATVLTAPWWLRPEPQGDEFETHRPVQLNTRIDGAGPEARGEAHVTVSVVDHAGQPVPDAPLTWSVEGRSDRDWWETDGDGQAELWVDLAERNVVTARRRATPQSVLVTGAGQHIVFRYPEHCPVLVTIHGPTDEPVQVPLEVTSADASWSFETDENGQVPLELPCAEVRIESWLEGVPTLSRVIDAGWTDELFLRFDAGLLIRGHVYQTDGEPIEGIRVQAQGQDSDRSEVDGGYQVWVRRPGPHVVTATHGGVVLETDVVLFPPNVVEVEHDLFLEPSRKVDVRCAGLEDDSCAWVPLVQCTEPHLPLGTLCDEQGGEVVCRCPSGEAAIRGGGHAVLVAPDEEIAWLDFRDEGALSGRVLLDGEPVRCRLNATHGLGVGVSGLAMRVDTCFEDGSFELANLEPGTWTLEVEAQGVKTTLGGLDVAGPLDVGDIELLDGTLVTGLVLDALTGEPAPGIRVAAVTIEDSTPTGAAGGTTDADGRYEIRGLDPGQVEVFLPTDPLTRESGALVDTLEIDLVREPPGDVSTQRSGRDVVVTALGDDAPAALEVGDRIVGVDILGIDPDDLIPGSSDALSDVLIGMGGAPGVTVWVERDGETWELD